MSDGTSILFTIFGIPIISVAVIMLIVKAIVYLNSYEYRVCLKKHNELAAAKRGEKLYKDIQAFKKSGRFTDPTEEVYILGLIHSNIMDRNDPSFFSITGGPQGSIIADAIRDVVQEELTKQQNLNKKK